MAETSVVASLTSAPARDGRDLREISLWSEWLEVRADLVGDINSNWIRGLFPGKLLYSLPGRNAGGSFDGSDEERLTRLAAAARLYDFVTLDAERDLRSDLLLRIPPEKRIITWCGSPVSYSEIAALFERLSAVPSKLYKLVVQNGRSADALAPLRLLKSLKRHDVTAFVSGETGFWSRLVAPHLGAPFVFGSVEPSWEATGDPSVEQLARDYGPPGFSDVTEIYGIVGSPVSHSLSPRIHNAAYRTLRHPGLFVPFQEESFADFWSALVTSGELDSLGLSLKGLTVASPHKEVALREAMMTSPMARRVGATNVFVRHNGGWKADTTDPESVALVSWKFGFSVRGKTAAVVGCGGAGRAIAAALDQAGALVTLVNRGTARGQMASRLLGLPFHPLSAFSPRGFSILVNATPVGRNDGKMPFEVDGLSQNAAVIDLVYGWEPTPLVVRARKAGLIVIDGCDVLEAQVLRQFHLMTGKRMPVELLREQLGRNGGRVAPAHRARKVMTSMNFVKAEDLFDPTAKMTPEQELDLSPLLGEWVNTNPASEGVARITLTLNDRKLLINMFGGSGSLDQEWGTVEANSVFAAEIGGRQAAAFSARYSFDSKEAHLLTNLSLGLLIVAICTTAGEAKLPVSFSREFYRRKNVA
jgi:3-dehydroquinate dehydratase / shikimate dehydrogenase